MPELFSRPDPVVLTLPGGTYAVINNRNDRENRAQAFQIFKQYIEENGLRTKGPLIFEYALMDLMTASTRGMHLQMQMLLEKPVSDS